MQPKAPYPKRSQGTYVRISSFIRKETEAWDEGSESHSNPPEYDHSHKTQLPLTVSKLPRVGREGCSKIGEPLDRVLSDFSSMKE